MSAGSPRGFDPLGADRDPDALSRGDPPPALSELLEQVARRRGWDRRLEEAQVHAVWQQVAGESLARHVAPVRLHGGVLVLRASSAAWATQVRYLTGELIPRLNAALGTDLVERVTVTTAGGADRSHRGQSS